MLEVIYIIGSIASIIGAIISWRFAGRARKYASYVMEQLSNKRKISELAELKTKWDETYGELRDFGPAMRESELRGKDSSKAAKLVQDYIGEVKKRSYSLSNINNLDEILREIGIKLKEFTEAYEAKVLKDKGSKLLGDLGDLDAKIRASFIAAKDKIEI